MLKILFVAMYEILDLLIIYFEIILFLFIVLESYDQCIY